MPPYFISKVLTALVHQSITTLSKKIEMANTIHTRQSPPNKKCQLFFIELGKNTGKILNSPHFQVK